MLLLNLDPMAGDHIEQSAAEMCDIALRLNVATQVNFNGVSIVALVGAKKDVVLQKYYAELKRPEPRVVVAGPMDSIRQTA